MKLGISLFRGSSFLEVVAVLGFGLLVVILLFPAPFFHNRTGGRKTQAKNDVLQLVTAIKYYQTEYGRLPLGETLQVEDDATQASLLRVLLGTNEQFNPRKIIFFEMATARKSGFWRDRKYGHGLHPETGVFLDPWGNPYRIRLSYTDSIENPYEDGKQIVSPVAVWSLGKDSILGSPGKENVLADSDDIVSWN